MAHTMAVGHDHSEVQEYLDFLNTMGVIASCCCIFSPMGSMFSIMRYGASGKELMGLLIPYSLYFTQCYLWSFYGILTDHIAIAQINVLGTTMCLMYLGIMANYAQLKDRVVLRPMVCLGVAMLFLCSMLCLLTCGQKQRLHIFSMTATFFACMLNIAPAVQSMEVIRTKSLEGFPVALTVAGFLACCIWSEYSLAIHDYGYLLPNLLGLIMNGGQICIICWVYYKQMELANDQSVSLQPILSYVKDVGSQVKEGKQMTYFKGMGASYSGISEGMWTFFSGQAFKIGGDSLMKASKSAAFGPDEAEHYSTGRNSCML